MKTLREIRKEHILKVLERTGWDLKKASAVLRVSEEYLKKEIHNIMPSGTEKTEEK